MTIQRFLLHSDFVNDLQDTSGAVVQPPITEDTLLQDIYDGEQWTSNYIGMNHVILADGMVKDVEVKPGSKKLLIECKYGLSFTFNMDW